jgi:hypothetical protein
MEEAFHPGNDPMIMLVHDLKLARPERNELLDARLGGVQVRHSLQPNRGVIILLSHNVVMMRFHVKSLPLGERWSKIQAAGFSKV